MKKLAFFLTLSLFSIRSFSQLSFSPLVAANFSKASTNKSEFSTSRVLRYTVGIQSSYHINDEISAGLGLQFSTKGYEDNAGAYRLAEAAKFQYFEANPFFEYRPIKFLGVVVGGNVAYLNSLEYKYIGEWQKPVKGHLYSENWDVQIAGGLKYYWGDAFVSLLFSQSILPFEKIFFTDANGITTSSLKEYHQSISLGVGYNLHLKKK
ncbi:MAG: outer membrane beta-barrel protein [Bacteroidetes bacterium]|nr:outer membrane beta-barrel protein [Bacteroidota bacterium]